MTSYSGALSQAQIIKRGDIGKSVSHIPSKLNAFLFFALATAAMTYVVFSNILVSQKYLLNSKKIEFGRRSAELAEDMNLADKTGLESLINFANSSGMKEAKDVSIIFSDSAFALEEKHR